MSDIQAGQVFGDAGAGASAGASIGSLFPGYGTAIGAGIGAVAGAGYGLISGALAPSYEDIYNSLMSQYTNSDAYKQEQTALAKLQGQTQLGPTAQEQAALQQAYNTANSQFNSQYGQIRQNLQRTQGTNSSTEAALMASQGAGQDNQMASMASSAAAQEDARRQSAIQAYTQATAQAAQMQAQYQQWASGMAQARNTGTQATTQGQIAQTMGAVGSIGAMLAKSQQTQPFNLATQQSLAHPGQAGGLSGMYIPGENSVALTASTPAALPAGAGYGHAQGDIAPYSGFGTGSYTDPAVTALSNPTATPASGVMIPGSNLGPSYAGSDPYATAGMGVLSSAQGAPYGW